MTSCARVFRSGLIALLVFAGLPALAVEPDEAGPATEEQVADERTPSERLLDEILALEIWLQTATPAERDIPHRRRMGQIAYGFDLETLDAWDMGLIAPIIALDETRRVPATRRLAALRDDVSAEGATASIVRTWLSVQKPDEFVDVSDVEQLLGHPGLGEALERDGAHRVYDLVESCVRTMNDADLRIIERGMLDLAEASGEQMPVWTALAAASLAAAVEERDRDHAVLSTLRANTLAALRARRIDRDEKFSHLDARMDHAIARLSLLDEAAPALVFEWTSTGFDAETLADLRGRVVLVDFWATWCRPCVAKFPARKQLVEHFDGRPVTLLGVTALQGFHYWDPFSSDPPAMTQGDPGREHELMGQYIETRGITWPIAFVPAVVTRDGYFVDALPHSTLIAPDGTVYRNGESLSMMPTARVIELIEGLLAEHGLE